MPAVVVASPEQVRSILGQSHRQWGAGLSLRDYREMWEELQATGWGHRWFSFLALVDGDDVLSSLKLYRPAIRIDGRTTRMCAIGAVFTPPALRREGHATRLLEEVVRIARERGDTPALLFSDIGTRFYVRLGFQPIPAEEGKGVLPARLPPVEPGWDLRPMRDSDIPAVAAIHDRACASRRVSVVRDLDHWRFIYRRAATYFDRLDGSDMSRRFQVALCDGTLAGYLVSVDGDGEWSLREAGSVDGRADTLASVLRLGARQARGAGLRRLHGWFPEGTEDLVPEWRIQREPRRHAVPMTLPLDAASDRSLSGNLQDVFLPFLDQF